jgi:hypothetical protein
MIPIANEVGVHFNFSSKIVISKSIYIFIYIAVQKISKALFCIIHTFNEIRFNGLFYSADV